MNILTFVFTGRVPSKKNSKFMAINRRTGRYFPMNSNDYKSWQQAEVIRVGLKLRKLNINTPLTGSVRISYKFYAGDNRAFDLSNKIESINDLFVDVGLLEDDNINFVKELCVKFCGVTKGEFKCIVDIEQQNI